MHTTGLHSTDQAWCIPDDSQAMESRKCYYSFQRISRTRTARRNRHAHEPVWRMHPHGFQKTRLANNVNRSYISLCRRTLSSGLYLHAGCLKFSFGELTGAGDSHNSKRSWRYAQALQIVSAGRQSHCTSPIFGVGQSWMISVY